MNNGISYFPLDVHLDEKFELIEAEFGLKGFAVIVKLFQKIYGGQGYYCKWTKDVGLLFAKRCGVGYGLVSQIVQRCVEKGIFDKRLFEDYQILTSKGVQIRYLDAVSRRKKVEIQNEYLLVKVDQIPKNVSIFQKNVNILSENDNIFKQSKGKESKVKYSKVEESNSTFSAADECIQKYNQYIGLITPAIAEGIDFYLSQGVEPKLINRIIEYSAEQNKRSWQYISAALNGNFKEGITTLEAYERARADFLSKNSSSKKSKKTVFSERCQNTEKTDYEKIQAELMAEMFE